MVIFFILFLTGLLLGSTVCNLTCGPLIIVRIGGHGKGWRNGLRLSLYFSLARMFVLVILGIILGGIGYSTSRVLDVGSIIWFSPAVYLVIGVFSVINGLHFYGVLKKKDARSCSGSGVKNRVSRMIVRMLPSGERSERATMIGIGLLMSVVCFGEGWLILLGAAPIVGTSATSWVEGALFGGLAMFSFSAGLSLPLVIMSTLASEAGNRLDLENLLRAGGVILVLIGTFLIVFEIYALISLLS